jgi:hypothetical protein
MERKYYLVDPAGKSMEAIKEWRRLSEEAYAKAAEITKEFGAKSEFLKNHESLIGLLFEQNPGRGWKPIRNFNDGYVPDKRIKEGKIIAKRLAAVQIPHTRTFSSLIGGGYFIIVSGGRWASISFETIGDAHVVSVPIGQYSCDEKEFIPPDTRLLKMSEYYAMKEAASEGKG